MLRSPPWLEKPFLKICVTNEHGYVPPFVSSSWSVLHSILITGFVSRVTWWVSLVEQELLTRPEHLDSPTVIGGVRIARSLVDCVAFCRSLYLFVLLLLAIVLSAFLLLTDAGYPFGIFKLMLIMIIKQYNIYIYRGPEWLSELGSWIT